ARTLPRDRGADRADTVAGRGHRAQPRPAALLLVRGRHPAHRRQPRRRHPHPTTRRPPAASTTATSPWSPKPSRWPTTPGPPTKESTMIANLQAHYGFSRMPFGRELAPGMLHRHDAHNQAAARITWCIQQRALGVLTGEVGAGKTVALRAALAGLDQS